MEQYESKQITLDLEPPKVEVDVDLGEDVVKNVEAAPEPQKTDDADEGIERLRKELDQKRREADEANRLRAEAEALARQREAQVHSYATEAQDSKLTAFVNAIASFERDGEMLERAFAEAYEKGDFAQVAKIQRQINQVDLRLDQLSQGKAALEADLEAKRAAPPVSREADFDQGSNDPVEKYVKNLSPQAQTWIRNHPEVVTDRAKNTQLTAAHWDALASGVSEGSPDYFAHIERKMGYAENNETPAPRETTPAPRTQRVPGAAAPVSRTDTAIITRKGNRIEATLTPAMREAAEINGMTEKEYIESMLYYADKGRLQI